MSVIGPLERKLGTIRVFGNLGIFLTETEVQIYSATDLRQKRVTSHNLTTNYDNFVCMYLCMYLSICAQTAITKKLEVETRQKFTIRYKIS